MVCRVVPGGFDCIFENRSFFQAGGIGLIFVMYLWITFNEGYNEAGAPNAPG
jgi:hypothetical protein